MYNTLIILFGATGDLARRKLIPALYELVQRRAAQEYAFLLIGYEACTVERIYQQAQIFVDNDATPLWNVMIERSIYYQGDVTNSGIYADLYKHVIFLENRWKTKNRLVYCAVPADIFCTITTGITKQGILDRNICDNRWHRIVYEKPFGHDQHSAIAINDCIAACLSESQIFRVDHYLAKAIIRNIPAIRCINSVFEQVWNCTYINYIEIILDESDGIGMRGGYYDRYGALRDVVQNHILQMLALVAMETPPLLTENCARDQRREVLQHTTCLDGLLGQYRGYRNEVHNISSMTETFAVLLMQVDTVRWKDSIFVLRTGKLLHTKKTVINIIFRDTISLLIGGLQYKVDTFSIHIAPKAAYSLTLNMHEQQEINLSDQMTSTESDYLFLLNAVMHGKQTVSVHVDEIEYSWRIIDMIYAKKLPLYEYMPGSVGPQEIEQLFHTYTIRKKI
jgi:glucose-6-phosphate 1-dehydrogenase